MKIVFIGPFGLQPKTTMRVRALPLAKALAARGHTVTLLIPPWDDPDRSGHRWVEDGVAVVNVSLPGPGPARWPVLFHLLLARTLVVQALALQPDVVHLFKPKAYAGLAHLMLWWLRRLKGLGVRLVVDTDDWEHAWNDRLPYSPLQKKFFTWQERWGLAHADAITVASRALTDLITTRLPVNPARLFYVPNGCRSEMGTRMSALGENPALSPNGLTSRLHHRSPLRASENAPVILLFSRFAEFRLERIVTLIRLVADQVPQARWLIVGRGFNGEEQQLAAKLAQANLIEYASFVSDWIPPDQLPAYFAAADVAIHPYDNTLLNQTKCSVKLIDLLTAGLPVVADAVGQNCEYLEHDLSGMLVPAEDDLAFSRALIMLLQEPDRRQRLGQAAARMVQERFSWSHLAQIAERAYH